LEKRKVPTPPMLSTLAAVLAMFSPQAINFGASVDGGELMFYPWMALQEAVNWFWLLVFGTIFETILVYEVIRYSTITGRSFFVATKDIPPKGILAMVLGGCNGCMAFLAWLVGRSCYSL